VVGQLLLRLTFQTNLRQTLSDWWETRPRGQAMLLLATAAWLAIALLIGLVFVLAKCVQVLFELL
jgi:hypothetical protein